MLVYVEGNRYFNEFDRYLLQTFSSNLAIGYDNIFLNNEVIDTQREVIFTLGEIVETRSKETANHVRRVAEYSYLLATLAGCSDEEAELVRLASPMHDIGKIGIPDHILNKPGKLTTEEFEIIKSHTQIGFEILKQSNRKIMKTAATIALQHHERWDGSGYPNAVSGDAIHLYGRITSVADVFDALGHKRVYKDAWEEKDILDYMLEQSGVMFDPKIVQLLFDNIEKMQEIKTQYPD
jgi:response regulator RpfG family c-di-GMP phosphodiesterase